MKFLVLPGDGIGPEISNATIRVVEAAARHANLAFSIQEMAIGEKAIFESGTTMPRVVMDEIPKSDGVILGPVSHFTYPQGQPNPSAVLRTHFDLYANIRPCRSREGLTILRRPMDLVIVRENTEGFYSDRNMFAGTGEFMPDPDSAFSIRKITAKAVQKVTHAAFSLAMERRKHVTAVHKANVLKMSDGLFLREFRAVAAQYPDVETSEIIVDAAAALLVREPDRFDVLVTTNMFGDILSDEASELSGSLGLGGSINAGSQLCVAQAQHGSAPDIAGRGIANPTSLILSSAMMLDWMARKHDRDDLSSCARLIEQAVETTLSMPALRTRDIGGTATTEMFTASVVENIGAQK